MRGAMESVTRMALQEMIAAHANKSRFGYLLSDEGMQDLIDTLYEFFETSRSLKSAGDRMLQQGGASNVSYRSSPTKKNL